MSAFTRLLALCSLYLRLLLLRIQLFITQTLSLYKSKANRSILLMGDGIAEGFGDRVGKTGLTSRLNDLLADDHSLRLSWRVLSAGRLWSTAADWHPTEGALFRDTVAKQSFRDADVILLTFGMHDDPATAPELVANIANALVRMGKHVVVIGFFNPHAPKSEQHSAFRSATQDLERRLTFVKECNTSPDCGSLSFGADPVKVCVLGADTLSDEEGFCTFNSRGYRVFTSDLFDDIVAAAKRVEWLYWKKRLSPS